MEIINKNKDRILITLTILLIVARVALMNINTAEWGDSYRILRASNYLRDFSYPEDEKRPPLFSLLLALRPANVDAVMWGRLFMLFISFLSYYVFYLLSKKFLTGKRQKITALIFLLLNPVFLYWSLRIYADVPFSLLVLINFYLLELWREKKLNIYLFICGIVSGAAILTRFEGYLLAASTVFGVLLLTSKNFSHKISSSLIFVLGTLLIVTPWLVYRNPLTSSYFEEPAGRKYDLTMLLTYLTSYIFILGIIPAAAVVSGHLQKTSTDLKNKIFFRYPHIIVFVLLESVLILAWPAAVPRLFVPVIPLLIIAFVKYHDLIPGNKDLKQPLILSAVLTLLYVILQNKLRLQFLGPHTLVFIAVIILSVTAAVSLVLRNKRTFFLSSVLSMAILSLSTIYLHKNIYSTISEIAQFSSQQIQGETIHNDGAGIVSWYVPSSLYKNLSEKKYLTREYLEENKINNIILTNEFNPDMEIDLKKRPYLELVRKSENRRGGKMFYTWLIRVKI